MRLDETLPTLKYPITSSFGLVTQRKFVCACDGSTSNILPSFSVLFCKFCQKAYASFVNAYCLTKILYFVSIFSELAGIKTIGPWYTISRASLTVDAIFIFVDSSPAKQS